MLLNNHTSKYNSFILVLYRRYKNHVSVCPPPPPPHTFWHIATPLILDTGILPDSWTLGIVKPIYKNKGNQQGPDNYRAITLISCMGKLFTAVINNRLKIFAIEINLINRNQAIFRKGHSTSDNIYCLHVLISLYLSVA